MAEFVARRSSACPSMTIVVCTAALMAVGGWTLTLPRPARAQPLEASSSCPRQLVFELQRLLEIDLQQDATVHMECGSVEHRVEVIHSNGRTATLHLGVDSDHEMLARNLSLQIAETANALSRARPAEAILEPSADAAVEADVDAGSLPRRVRVSMALRGVGAYQEGRRYRGGVEAALRVGDRYAAVVAYRMLTGPEPGSEFVRSAWLHVAGGGFSLRFPGKVVSGHLDVLGWLGVTALSTSPVVPAPSVQWWGGASLRGELAFVIAPRAELLFGAEVGVNRRVDVHLNNGGTRVDSLRGPSYFVVATAGLRFDLVVAALGSNAEPAQ